MSFLRRINGTDLQVSALGLGTVKFGRNEGVKYPGAFTIPDDHQLRELLAQAQDLGINFVDTAPAYGESESRLGALLTQRQDWVIMTKVGEEFSDGKSSFDFSAKHTRFSIERSLQRLRTNYLDIVLIHSDGDDEKILSETDCLETLQELKQQGLIRAIGMSTKTNSGGIMAAELTDMVMLTYNLQQQDQQALDFAVRNNKGVLVKKGLMSGHIQESGRDLLRESMQKIFSQAGVNSMIVGTINPQHLAQNVRLGKELSTS